ncbi:MAG: ChbG/HpnK family deacetylase [Clostridiales bacterium]|nr:ChbG/HpnK family deacetylase [Clostridiales bacterium]
MDKYLIINADDFGMSHASNVAVMDLLSNGCISSSTIMAPCPWAYEAAKFANKNPELGIGVHLTTTSEWGTYRWAPVIGTGNSLCDDTGVFMYHESDEFEEGADIDEIEAEIRAQIAKLKTLGVTNPSHLDNHMGSLYGIETGRFETLQQIFDIASEYKLPFRFPGTFTDEQFKNTMLGIKVDPALVKGLFGKFTAYAKERGVAIPDYLIPGEWSGPQRDSYENYKEYIYELYRSFPEGVVETYIHPAVECDELKAISGNWITRVWEYALFKDPQTMQHIKSLGIKLISYRDLAKMRG